MIQINKELFEELFAKAEATDRKRINYDLRTSPNDGGQRMLNAMLPGTEVPVHRHPMSNENVIVLVGRLVEILYDEEGKEKDRILLDPAIGNYGFIVPKGAWHTVEVLTPCVIYEAKDGKYGEDGSETFEEYNLNDQKESDKFIPNSIGDLKKNIEYLIGMERHSGSMDAISPLYVSRMLNVPLEDVEKAMQEINL